MEEPETPAPRPCSTPHSTPPPGFGGYQNRVHDGDNYYERSCTPEEVALIEDYAAVAAAEQAEILAFAESQRDTFFGALREELERFGEVPELAAVPA